jgi:hypothetical protein
MLSFYIRIPVLQLLVQQKPANKVHEMDVESNDEIS